MEQPIQQSEPRRMDASITFSCDQDLRETVETLAASEDRALGAMARILIKDGLRVRGLSEPEPATATSS